MLVHESKFGKSRNVVLHSSTAKQLRKYLSTRSKALGNRQAEAFLANRRGKYLGYHSQRMMFLRLLNRASIRVQVHPVNVPGAQGLNVEIGFDLHEIPMEEKNRRWTGALDAVLIVLDGRDQILKGTQYTMQLSFPPARYQDHLKEGVVYKDEIPLLATATQLRVVLRDASNSNIGSVSIPLAKYIRRANSAN